MGCKLTFFMNQIRRSMILVTSRSSFELRHEPLPRPLFIFSLEIRSWLTVRNSSLVSTSFKTRWQYSLYSEYAMDPFFRSDIFYYCMLTAA